MGTIVKKTIKIDGMHCTSCALSVDMDVEDIEGVFCCKTSYAKQTAEVEFDEEQVDEEEIKKTIEKLGYRTSVVVN